MMCYLHLDFVFPSPSIWKQNFEDASDVGYEIDLDGEGVIFKI